MHNSQEVRQALVRGPGEDLTPTPRMFVFDTNRDALHRRLDTRVPGEPCYRSEKTKDQEGH